jgi:hypothetical protein
MTRREYTTDDLRAIAQQRRESAESLLVHYFELACTRSDVQWDGDLESEVRAIVDGIVEAADHRAMARERYLESRIAAISSRLSELTGEFQ